MVEMFQGHNDALCNSRIQETELDYKSSQPELHNESMS